ncbi:MAG: type 1 glutamine amidotransferase [Gammaproteobacteria bacterium]|nr:type 1 glutamine amidotransferase [Gammaproteobacteria bacterium]MYJ52186.1 type 1 glutamine amidotransferase [Gammaproteobacteria bacterium]
MPTEPDILVFQHMPCQNPGIFRQYASGRNIRFDEIDLHAGEPIPDIRRYDGLWVMGGTMNVWEEDEFPWLREEKDAIREAVGRSIPYLGICLGHQLLADALGGTVTRTDCIEIGSHAIEPTEEGAGHRFLDGLCGDIRWANVHTAEVRRPPANATILARSRVCPNHAMSVGDSAYSVQFHPEVCRDTLSGWLAIPQIVLFMTGLLGADGLEAFTAGIETNRESTERGAGRLLDNWLSLTFGR